MVGRAVALAAACLLVIGQPAVASTSSPTRVAGSSAAVHAHTPVGASVPTRARPRASVKGAGQVLADRRVHIEVRSNASKVKVSYRTSSNRKRARTEKLRSGRVILVLPAGSRSITVAALATKRLRASKSVRVVPKPAPDITPPGAASSVAATLTGPTTVQLTWSLPEDDVASVVVRRAEGVTPPQAPDQGVDVPTRAGRATSVVDAAGWPAAQVSYSVFVVDAWGNPSAPSSTAIVTGQPLAAGAAHTCVVTHESTVKCWAATSSGSLATAPQPIDCDRPSSRG